jgi:hypothetical protein
MKTLDRTSRITVLAKTDISGKLHMYVEVIAKLEFCRNSEARRQYSE